MSHMERREFIALVGGGALLLTGKVRRARGQQPAKIPRIGILDDAPMWRPFQQALRDLGYIEGQNIAYEYRYSEGAPDQLATVAQELWRGTSARRAMTRDPVPVAFLQLIRRNRRRYGGYIVHAGIAVLLIGVAASSSFQHSHDVVLRPGQKVNVDGYTMTYVRPTASAGFKASSPAGRGSTSATW